MIGFLRGMNNIDEFDDCWKPAMLLCSDLESEFVWMPIDEGH